VQTKAGVDVVIGEGAAPSGAHHQPAVADGDSAAGRVELRCFRHHGSPHHDDCVLQWGVRRG
jgi:hypothetical protein